MTGEEFDNEAAAKYEFELLEQKMDARICPFMRGNCDAMCILRFPGRISIRQLDGKTKYHVEGPYCKLDWLLDCLENWIMTQI